MSAEPTLTEDEIRALEKALTTGTGRYDPIIPPAQAAEPLLDDGEPLCVAVAGIITARMASAWDEGYGAGSYFGFGPFSAADQNPYRTQGPEGDR